MQSIGSWPSVPDLSDGVSGNALASLGIPMSQKSLRTHDPSRPFGVRWLMKFLNGHLQGGIERTYRIHDASHRGHVVRTSILDRNRDDRDTAPDLPVQLVIGLDRLFEIGNPFYGAVKVGSIYRFLSDPMLRSMSGMRPPSSFS